MRDTAEQRLDEERLKRENLEEELDEIKETVEDLRRVVIGLVADQRADHDQLVHVARQTRKRFANLDSGDVGVDWFEFAADFLGSAGLEIDHVLVRRPARQEDHNDRFVRRRSLTGVRFKSKEVGEAQAAHGEAADFEKVAARDPVAKAVLRAQYIQHASSLDWERIPSCCENMRRLKGKQARMSGTRERDNQAPRSPASHWLRTNP